MLGPARNWPPDGWRDCVLEDPDGERLGPADALVGADRHDIVGEELVFRLQPLHRVAGDRHEVDGDLIRELAARRRRIAGDEEESVQRAVLHALHRLVRRHVLRLQLAFLHAKGVEDEPGRDERARADLVERDRAAAQVADRGDAGALAHHDMDMLGVEVGDRAQLAQRLLAGENTGAVISGRGDVGLDEA